MNKESNKNGQNGALIAEDLFFSFNDNDSRVDVLRGVSFEALSGEVTSISGPSGCGKSTLLYLLGLLERPSAGKIVMNGQEVQELNDQKRTKARNQMVGFVFQFHFLIKELTALENVRLPLLKNGTGRNIADERSFELLSELGLEEKAYRPAYKLSGGEQQRVAIARSLANSPKYLLADEPTGNLDSKNSEVVFDLLLKMSQKLKLAVILVTHNEKLAKLSSRKFEMKDGRILF
jgi:lipoprotein-releasing system ATP-binding protein